MFELRIKKDGTIERKMFDNDLSYWDEVEPEIVLGFSTYSVTLVDGFTVRSYFEMLEKYPMLQLLDQWFIEYMSKYRLVENTSNKPTVDTIVLQRFFEYDHSGIDASSPDIFECANEEENGLYTIDTSKFIYNDEKSIGSYVHVYGENKDEDESYSLSMEPLENLLQCGVVLQEKVCLQNHDPKVSSYSTEDIDTYNDFTLFEFVTSLINEISFFGNDSDKKKVLDDLTNSMDDIEKRLGKSEDTKKDDDTDDQ